MRKILVTRGVCVFFIFDVSVFRSWGGGEVVNIEQRVLGGNLFRKHCTIENFVVSKNEIFC